MSTKYKGYMGKVMEYDLSTGIAKEYPWSDEERELFTGGKSMAAKIIADHLQEITEPLASENMLVITTGPLTGSGAPSSSRFNISTISPLTGILTSSNCGGNFGYFLKKAGYDGLIIRGRSKSPVWMEIENENFTLHDAEEMWGLCAGPSQEALDLKLSEAAGGRKVKNGKLVIGPAGENLVSYASVISNERLCGRGGVGAVMGSKNLKGVTVTGNHKVEVAEPEKMKELNKKWFKLIREHPLMGDQLPRMGTAGIVSTLQMNGQFATKNYSRGQYEEFEKINGETLAEDYNVVNKGCLTCPIRCARTVTIDGKEVKGPELEILCLLSGGIMSDNMELILRWNYELDELGMDTISASNTLAFAMELNEKGLWDNGLKFGKTDNISQIWEDIAYRRGIGDALAEGTKALSEKYGGKEFAAHSKGMELAAYEPRRSVGLGLGYAVSNRGGCHLNGGYLIIMEGLGMHIDPQATKSKPDMTVLQQDLMEQTSAAGQCVFTTYGMLPSAAVSNPNSALSRIMNKAMGNAGSMIRKMNKNPEMISIHLGSMAYQSEALEYATGIKGSFGTFLKCGKRAYTLERLINTRLGISRKDDRLPKRLTEEAQIKGDDSTRVHLEEMKDVYYEARGWDSDGIPTEETLKELGLDHLAVCKMPRRDKVEGGARVGNN